MVDISDYTLEDKDDILKISSNNLGIIDNPNFSNPLYEFLVSKVNNEVVGYICYMILIDRIEIIDITVCQQCRFQGIGTKMLSHLIDKYQTNNFTDISLEVSKTNKEAINLYNKLGFKEIRIIPNYYKNKDGILMKRDY